MVELSEIRLNDTFHALADTTRREILRGLAVEERTVTDLAKPFSMSLAAVSKHIQVLERAGLVSRTVRGRTHVCRLAPQALAEASTWINTYERFWTARLDALESLFNQPKKESKRPRLED